MTPTFLSDLFRDYTLATPSYTSDAAGHAIGATTINLAAGGTGLLLTGDQITFAGDTNIYTLAACVPSPQSGVTSVTLAAPGLVQALPASAKAITLSQRVLRVQSLSDPKVAKPPRLLFEVKAQDGRHPRKVIWNVHALLTGETTVNLRSTAEDQLEALRLYLTDAAAFDTWIQASRTDAQRNGWQPVKMQILPSEESFNHDDTELTYQLVLPVRITIYE